jgi:acylphosphatase
MNQASNGIAKRIQVYGRVQGVNFRTASRREARSLRLTGWAHNESDGSVTIVVEGSCDAVDQFAEWCERGPSNARVERIEISDETYSGLDSFHIR